MDNPTRRLDQPSPAPNARPCLRCGTPMFDALIRAQNTNRLPLQRYPLQLLRQRGTSFLRGVEYAETGCSVWVCPDCGYTELAANNPAALLEGR